MQDELSTVSIRRVEALPLTGFGVNPTPYPPPEEFAPFRVEVRPQEDGVRVVPIGELDLATVDEVDARLFEAFARGVSNVVLDLRALRFMDSCGLHLVLSCDAQAKHGGTNFTLIDGSPAIQRLFDLADVRGGLSFRDDDHPSDQSALAAFVTE